MGLSYYLDAIDWFKLVTINLTVNSLWSAFADVLNVAIAQFVSVKRVANRSDSKRIKQAYPIRIKAALARKRCL